jgi:hypothetical protein
MMKLLTSSPVLGGTLPRPGPTHSTAPVTAEVQQT